MKLGNEKGIIKGVNERLDDEFQKTTTLFELKKEPFKCKPAKFYELEK